MNHRESPAFAIASLWIVFSMTALLGARAIHSDLALDDRARGRAILLPIAEVALRVADSTGFSGLNDRLSVVPELLDRTPVLWAGNAPGRQAEPATGTDAAESGREPGVPISAGPWRPENGLLAPKRVLLIGASSIQYYLGAELEHRLEEFDGVEVRRVGKLSTGLTRPDVYDWPSELRELKDEFKPDLVIALFGGNDCQPMEIGRRVHHFGSPEWNAEYAARLREFVGLMREGGRAAVVLGMPTMRSKRFSKRLQKLNTLLERETAAAGGVFIPTWDLTSDARGNYLKSVEYDGVTRLMRLADGIHYSRHGSRYISARLAARLQHLFNFEPDDAGLAAAYRFYLDSPARGETTSYLAFVSQKHEGGLPVLFLLHGADGSWKDWSEHAHEALQRLATTHGLVIVTPDGRPGGWYVDAVAAPGSAMETYFVKELLPDVARGLPVTARRGIAGLSMGGHGALMLALRNPGVFLSASSTSGVVDLEAAKGREDIGLLLGPFDKNREAWLGHSVLHLAKAHPDRARATPILLAVGAEDRWLNANRRLHETLDALSVEHSYHEEEGRGHDWRFWVAELERHVVWHAERLGNDKSRVK